MNSCKNDHIYEPDASLPFGAARIQLIAMGLALFASTVAPFGGFAASATKRAFNIKDFDNLMPGHGGFMDRMVRISKAKESGASRIWKALLLSS